MTVFSLGGTIASTHDDATHDDATHATPDGGGVTPRLGADDLVAAVPGLADGAELTTVAFRQVPSGDLTLPDTVALAAEIGRAFAAGATGVVVTQGTDTLEETAFALDLLVDAEGPVVVTGAMRNPTLAGADGPANLLAAVQVAGAPQARGLGTVVVLSDEVHAARFVRKTHASSTATFASPTTGPLGWVTEGRCRIALRPPVLPRVVPADRIDQVPPVALLTAALGDDGRLLGPVRAAGYAGLVVAGFGGGHVPASWVPGLATLAAELPVVLAGRTGAGETLRQTYGFPGSERDLLARGLVPAGFLDAPKSRVLLSLLLAAGAGAPGIRDAFAAVGAL